MYNFEKMSKTWHYNRELPSNGELRKLGTIEISAADRTLVGEMLDDPLSIGGCKRIHSGDPALNIDNPSINNRSKHMREIGYNENHFFYEFNDEKFSTLTELLKLKKGVSHEHYCSIIVPPGQCMPAHGDTYGYLQRYCSRDA